eukprot:TRINITY_DN10142_c0_g3_i4.p1 TRINITY_DN10142_c0_g3~~TRINITY_DN10142_c0_g3_i4.p1  ORF type:complete len:126 (-),score=11.87 TRINITY_DN10142_c0_g3_i4:12-389(-)
MCTRLSQFHELPGHGLSRRSGQSMTSSSAASCLSGLMAVKEVISFRTHSLPSVLWSTKKTCAKAPLPIRRMTSYCCSSSGRPVRTTRLCSCAMALEGPPGQRPHMPTLPSPSAGAQHLQLDDAQI